MILEKEGIPLGQYSKLKWFLNTNITRDRAARTITLDLNHLIEDAKKKFLPADQESGGPEVKSMKMRPAKTPFPSKEKLRGRASPSFFVSLLHVNKRD